MLPSDFFFAISQVHQYREPCSPHNPMHCPYLAEAVTTIMLVIQSAVTAFMLAYAPSTKLELWEWTLLPIIGATVAAGGAFCLNTQQEIRRIVIGRCLFAWMLGVIGPRLMTMIHPWFSEVLGDPLLKVGAGFTCGFLGYILSWPFVKGFYARATPMAEQLVKAAEAKLVANIASQVAANVSQVASGVAVELASNPSPETPAHTAEVIANVSKQNIETKPE